MLANLTRINFLRFLDEILTGILAKNARIGLKMNVHLGSQNQLKTCILLQNVMFLPRLPMIDHLTRLQALISDSGLFKAGREHEREHVKALIRVRMDQLHHNSIAWQECRNLYNIIK